MFLINIIKQTITEITTHWKLGTASAAAMAHGKVICESVNLHPTNAHSTVFSVGQRRRRRPAAATMSLLFIFILVILINISCVDCLYQHQHSYHSDSSKNLVNLEAKVGSHVVFNCRVDFPYDYDIPYIIHWSKDAKKIFTWYEGTTTTNDLYSGRLSLLKDNQDYGKASVNLTAIRESDQGRYHCQIMFPNRTPSIRNNGTFYHLVVEGGSLIKIPPINQTIMEGQTAFFHCTMKFPETSTIIWSKDGVALHDIQEIYRRSYFGPDGSLSIDPTMMSDLGHYECSVRNNDGEVQTSSAYLNIQYKAKVIYSPPEVYLPYGHPAVLDCHFRSNPPLKNLRWEKDGLLFDSYNVPGVFYKVNGSLFFSKVDETHTGSYTCTPYNELGTDGPSPIIHVIVLRPPIFTQRPKQIYIHKLGEDVHFTCEAADRDGHHHPTVSWSRKDGTPLPADRYIVEGGNLTLLQIEESDRGIFECAATNEAATVTADTELMIENIAPRPPSNLTAVNATLHSITIRWQPGYLRPDLEYIVLYRVAEAAEWRTMKSTSKDMELTINNLLPGTEYEFMVLSQDRFGDGMFSKPHKFYTNSPEEDSEQETVDEQLTSEELEEKQISDYVNSHQAPQTVSIGPPRNFFIMERKDGYILTWDPPEIGLDQLRIYIIRWWLEEDTKLYGSAETIETFYLIRHLREDSTYRVQVATLSITDDQSGSDVLEIKVPAHRKMRAITIGTTVVIIFIIAIVFVFYYLKRRFCRPHTEISSEKMDCGDD